LSALSATEVSGSVAVVNTGAVASCVAEAAVLVAGAGAFWMTVATVLVAGAVTCCTVEATVLVAAEAVLAPEAATEVAVLASAAVWLAGAWTVLDTAGALGAVTGDACTGAEAAGLEAGFDAVVTDASVSLATAVALAPAAETLPVSEESPPLALAAGAARPDRTMTAVAAQQALLVRLARNPPDDKPALEAERPARWMQTFINSSRP
jgi:hypothetical protein